MKQTFLFGIFAALLSFSTPSYAVCGDGAVSYLRTSQHLTTSNRTDLRLKVIVTLDSEITTDTPVVDVTSSFVCETGTSTFSFQLAKTSEGRWEYTDSTDNSYTRVKLYDNRDGTATIRVAMRSPSTVSGNGLGYFASVRSCQ